MKNSEFTSLTALAVVGAVIGLGQLLQSNDPITPRVVLGRALVSGGLGASAASITIWFPDLPVVAVCGLAAAIASLGTSGLERMLQRFLGKPL